MGHGTGTAVFQLQWVMNVNQKLLATTLGLGSRNQISRWPERQPDIEKGMTFYLRPPVRLYWRRALGLEDMCQSCFMRHRPSLCIRQYSQLPRPTRRQNVKRSRLGWARKDLDHYERAAQKRAKRSEGNKRGAIEGKFVWAPWRIESCPATWRRRRASEWIRPPLLRLNIESE